MPVCILFVYIARMTENVQNNTQNMHYTVYINMHLTLHYTIISKWKSCRNIQKQIQFLYHYLCRYYLSPNSPQMQRCALQCSQWAADSHLIKQKPQTCQPHKSHLATALLTVVMDNNETICMNYKDFSMALPRGISQSH